MNNKLLRADQVQRRLACSRSMVCKLLREKRLRGFKCGATWRVYENSLEEYIQEQEETSIACTA